MLGIPYGSENGYATDWAVLPVSPASPEYAIRVCLFNWRVLLSSAFRMVAPRMAALDAAISVKSLPVMPSRTSLENALSDWI